MFDDTDSHCIDQGVPFVAVFKVYLATDGRHSEAIAIVSYTVHDFGDEMLDYRALGIAKTERIQSSYRACSHRKDVAQDPANSRRCAMIWLDGRRMVMALNLEADRQIITDIDDSGVLLSRFGKHCSAFAR